MLPGNFVKFTILGLSLVVAMFGFAQMNLNSESERCRKEGYGNWNEDACTCDPVGDYADNIVIVTGNTANSPKPSFDENSQTYSFLENSIAKNANIKIVSASSNLETEQIKEKKNEDNELINAEVFIKKVNSKIDLINNKISQKP